jgi:hypothetical protein
VINENIYQCKQHLHPSFPILISALEYQKFDHVLLFQPFLFLISFNDVTSSPAVSKLLLDYPNASSKYHAGLPSHSSLS